MLRERAPQVSEDLGEPMVGIECTGGNFGSYANRHQNS